MRYWPPKSKQDWAILVGAGLVGLVILPVSIATLFGTIGHKKVANRKLKYIFYGIAFVFLLLSIPWFGGLFGGDSTTQKHNQPTQIQETRQKPAEEAPVIDTEAPNKDVATPTIDSSQNPKSESSGQPPASSTSDVVKKSSTGICHAPGTTYYNQTKKFTPYKTLQECLDSGGRLPKR